MISASILAALVSPCLTTLRASDQFVDHSLLVEGERCAENQSARRNKALCWWGRWDSNPQPAAYLA